MGRPKGQPKLGGRKKGTPNKVPAMKPLRISLQEQGFNLGDEIIKLYATADDNMKLKLLQLITQYTQVAPKEEIVQPTEATDSQVDTDALLKAVK